MSHTMNIKTELRDKDILAQVCSKLGYNMTDGTARIFQTRSSGTVINLPGFRYPIVVKEDGSVDMDTYNGKWGDERELHKLEAHYAAEKARYEATSRGYDVEESYDKEGNEIVLEINLDRCW